MRVVRHGVMEAGMARAYSQDLRNRVIDAGSLVRSAAESYGIRVATGID